MTITLHHQSFTAQIEVDVEELRAVVAAITGQSATLRALADEVDAASATLHAEWSGLASDAHVTAHTRWAGDFVQMREARTELHTIGAPLPTTTPLPSRPTSRCGHGSGEAHSRWRPAAVGVAIEAPVESWVATQICL